MKISRILIGITVAVVLIGTAFVAVQSLGSDPTTPASEVPGAELDALRNAHDHQESNVQVHGTGTVVRVLPDDTEGDRHQRFILEVPLGFTVLIAHNIDLAPRLDGVAEGDTVEFFGEYEWSDQGGTVHWTHHDPAGVHPDGWVAWGGTRYE